MVTDAVRTPAKRLRKLKVLSVAPLMERRSAAFSGGESVGALFSSGVQLGGDGCGETPWTKEDEGPRRSWSAAA